MKERTSGIGGAITQARIAALFAPLSKAGGVLLAVSGGPDSTALLLMAARWASEGGRPSVEVATVDHGLRVGSRAEAETVGALARRLGLTHHLIEWRGPKPRSRVQERAREARYRLLGACAQQIGADFLVTAHHADDQAETVIFRLLRGSGIAGLRGIETVAPLGPLTLARPLLGMRKSELVAYCEACGEPFARDPSNLDPRYARTNLRQLADLLAAAGLGPDEFARLARRAGRMEEAVAAAVKTAAERLGWNEARPNRDAKALLDEPAEIAQRLLRREIAQVVGKEERQVRLDAIESLTEALRAARAQDKAMRANVGGASVHLSAKGALSVTPEAPRRLPRSSEVNFARKAPGNSQKKALPSRREGSARQSGAEAEAIVGAAESSSSTP